jgi:hypothetical protein
MTTGEPTGTAVDEHRCRGCGEPGVQVVIDLGDQPLASAYPLLDDEATEPRWPLRAGLCRRCMLVQLLGDVPLEPQEPGTAPAAQSSTMRQHGRGFVDEALALRGEHGGPIVEVASHGGHLQPFFRERGVDTLILEGWPALADHLEATGATVHRRPLGVASATDVLERLGPAAVVVDNYLLSHTEDPTDLVAGIAQVLEDDGLAVFEFDHLLPIVVGGQFDAIRHGHFTYWSLHAFRDLLGRFGVELRSVTRQPVYGGALRVVAGPAGGEDPPAGPGIDEVLHDERAAGLDDVGTYERFAKRAARSLADLRAFLERDRPPTELVVGYGAPARGSTLLNAAALTPAHLPFTVDRSPAKQGRRMPGCRIPIESPDRLRGGDIGTVVILTWDISREVVGELGDLREAGVRFVVPIPELSDVAT